MPMSKIAKKVDQTVRFIRKQTSFKPDIGLILGSGLGELVSEIDEEALFPFSRIPNFASCSIVGHAGNLVLGNLQGKNVCALSGRLHYYEGHSMEDVVFPTRVMGGLGIKKLIVTNSAGAVAKSFKVGDLMLITDHINLLGKNPLRGDNPIELGPRFVDMTYAYDQSLLQIARKVAKKEKILLREGIYVASSGPTYETPAEIRMIRTIGGDAAGMSTVPEVIAANHMNIRVLGISCLTNMAAGVLDQPLSHEEVIETTEKVKETFKRFIKSILKEI